MRNARAAVLEALLIALFGIGFALLANALSPLGLRLSRDYFPGGETARQTARPAAPPVNATNAVTNAVATLSPAEQRLQQRGLHLVSSNEVVEAFRDSRYQQGLFVFVDARDDQHYQAGHIPGAWQFNHYRPEQYLPTVLPLCLSALRVIVYCTGGTCEDSEFAAVMLRDAGVTPDNLYVYAGGINEWKTNSLPIELGARGSGQYLKPN